MIELEHVLQGEMRATVSVPTTLRSFLTGHVSTTLVAAHMSHTDMTLFRGSAGYVLTSMSFTNPRSAGASGGYWQGETDEEGPKESKVG